MGIFRISIMIVIALNTMLIEITYSLIQQFTQFDLLDTLSQVINLECIHIQPTHMVALTSQNIIMYLSGNESMNYNMQQILNPIASQPMTQVKTLSFNTGLANGCYLVLNPINIYCFTNNFLSSRLVYQAAALENIVDAYFGNDCGIVVCLLTDGSYYSLLYLVNATLVSRVNTSVSITSSFDKMLVKQELICLSFDSKILIYSCNMSLTLLKQIPHPTIQKNDLDISINPTLLARSHNNTITFYLLSSLYSSSLPVYKTIYMNQSITGITFAQCYLIVSTELKVYQIDVEIFVTVHEVVNEVVPTDKYLVQYFQFSGDLILYKAYPRSNQQFNLYYVNSSYQSSTSSCQPRYTYDASSSLCSKSCSSNISIDTSLITSNYTTSNATNYTTISNTTVVPSNTTNNASNSSSSNSTEMNNHTNSSLNQSTLNSAIQQSLLDNIDKQTIRVLTQALGKTMIISSMKISPNFLLSFTGFLDDLWYYKFHRTQYPKSILFFMGQVNVINQIRLNAWFLNFLAFFEENSVQIDRNQNQYHYLGFGQRDPQEVYFLHSSEQIYKSSLILNILMFGCMKLFWFLFCFIEKKFKTSFIDKVTKTLKCNCKWWLLLVAFIETNILRLTFNCFLQIFQPSSYQFIDKFNLLVAFLSLFILLMYTISFYPLIFKKESRIYSQNLLIKSKYKMPGFYLQCFNSILRNFIRSIIHSYFIRSYNIQMTMLIISDVFFIVLTLKMFKYFKYRIIGVLNLFYMIAFFALNVFLATKQNIKHKVQGHLDEEFISLVMVLLLLSISIFTSIILLIISISNIFQVLRCRNKIIDQSKIENNRQQTIIIKKEKLQVQDLNLSTSVVFLRKQRMKNIQNNKDSQRHQVRLKQNEFATKQRVLINKQRKSKLLNKKQLQFIFPDNYELQTGKQHINQDFQNIKTVKFQNFSDTAVQKQSQIQNKNKKIIEVKTKKVFPDK